MAQASIPPRLWPIRQIGPGRRSRRRGRDCSTCVRNRSGQPALIDRVDRAGGVADPAPASRAAAGGRSRSRTVAPRRLDVRATRRTADCSTSVPSTSDCAEVARGTTRSPTANGSPSARLTAAWHASATRSTCRAPRARAPADRDEGEARAPRRTGIGARHVSKLRLRWCSRRSSRWRTGCRSATNHGEDPDHLSDPANQEMERGQSYADFNADRGAAMQETTAQMVLLKFMTAGLNEAAVPSTADRWSPHPGQGRAPNTDLAQPSTRTRRRCSSVASARYGIGFWGPGSGIIHQVVWNNDAFPADDHRHRQPHPERLVDLA